MQPKSVPALALSLCSDRPRGERMGTRRTLEIRQAFSLSLFPQTTGRVASQTVGSVLNHQPVNLGDIKIVILEDGSANSAAILRTTHVALGALSAH